MLAGGADLWGLLSVVDVPAVEAVPLDLLVPLEYRAVLDVLQELPVSLLVLLLYLGDLRVALGDVEEPFLLCHLCEVGVEGSPLQEFTFGGR